MNNNGPKHLKTARNSSSSGGGGEDIVLVVLVALIQIARIGNSDFSSEEKKSHDFLKLLLLKSSE